VKCMRCANAYHDTCLRDIIFLRKGKHIVCDQHELDASELAMREVSTLSTNFMSSAMMYIIVFVTHRVYAVEHTACYRTPAEHCLVILPGLRRALLFEIKLR
jgi:hypothetical protein